LHKKTLVKIGLVVFILLLFVGYNIYLKWDKTNFTVDSEVFNVKDHFSQVMDEEYKWNGRLRLADQFNKIKSIDIAKELPNEQRQIKIHKAWFTMETLFILYSINLQKDDQAPDDIPELNFSEVTFETSNGDVKSFDTRQYGRYREGYEEDEYEGEVFEKRLYRSMVLGID